VIVRTAPHRVEARAELAFARRAGRTVLAASRVEAPLALVRPFDLDDGGLLLQLLSLGPGLCGGDRLLIDITAGAGTRVVITTTAATRIMSMDDPSRAEQHVILRAADNATLEYYPCVTIPYPDSALLQTITCDVRAGARAGVVECWAMGRTARAEYLRFRSLSSRTVLSIDGVIEYADAIHLEPSVSDIASAGVLARRRYLASGVWAGVTLPSDTTPGDAGGDSLVVMAQSSPVIAYLRALGNDGPPIERAIRESVELAARGWGVAPVSLNRFHS
jgi:urease accessory protein